MKETREVE